MSKRTVYSHYGDKERLFMSVVQTPTTSSSIRSPGSPAACSTAAGEPAARLTRQFIRDVARVAISGSPQRAALLRLMLTEATHFPALREHVAQRRTLLPLLTAALALLGPGSGLAVDDPAQAAEHLSALTFGQINNRSLFGLTRLSDDEIDAIVTSGVRCSAARSGRPARPATSAPGRAARRDRDRLPGYFTGNRSRSWNRPRRYGRGPARD